MEPKNLETALVEGAVTLLHKKFGGVIVIALVLAKIGAPAWMPFGLGLAFLLTQGGLDAWEKWLKQQEPPAVVVTKAEP